MDEEGSLPGMTRERWKLVEEVYSLVRGVRPEERARDLERLCRDDPALAAEVVSLLEQGVAAEADRFLADTSVESTLGSLSPMQLLTRLAASWPDESSAAPSGQATGGYPEGFEDLRAIGQGGMGI